MSKRILKDIVKEQDLTIGMFQQLVHPEVTEFLATTGLDYVILDLEHTGHTVESLNPCLMAAAAHNLPMLVRVAEKEQALIEQVLDAGAQGVVVPTVETVEDCELIVRSTKFAPEGTRGWCNIPPVKRWMNTWEGDVDGDDFNPDTYGRYANENIFVAALVETPLGIENLPEMLKVDGIDAFLLGSGDLSIRMGRTLWDPEVAAVVADATRQIQEAGKISCPIGLVSNIEALHENGARMVMLGISERMALQSRLRQETRGMRDIVDARRVAVDQHNL